MSVTVYRSDDVGAPVLYGTAGSLNNVLEACLVTGYGAKAAAGWTKQFSSSSNVIAVFKMAAGGTNMVLRVDTTSGTSARLLGYESMSDISTGVGKFPVESQISGGLWAIVSSNTSTARPWIVIADGRAMYVLIGATETSIFSWASGDSQFFFGDFTSYVPGDVYNCAIISRTGTAAADNAFGFIIASTANNNGHYIARDFKSAPDKPMPFGKLAGHPSPTASSGAGISGGLVFPDPITGGLRLTAMEVFEQVSTSAWSSAGIRGKLPGLWAILQNAPGAPLDTIPGNGSLAGKSFLLLPAFGSSTESRFALEISDTWR